MPSSFFHVAGNLRFLIDSAGSETPTVIIRFNSESAAHEFFAVVRRSIRPEEMPGFELPDYPSLGKFYNIEFRVSTLDQR